VICLTSTRGAGLLEHAPMQTQLALTTAHSLESNPGLYKLFKPSCGVFCQLHDHLHGPACTQSILAQHSSLLPSQQLCLP
jgi:hypothetical protein